MKLKEKHPKLANGLNFVARVADKFLLNGAVFGTKDANETEAGKINKVKFAKDSTLWIAAVIMFLQLMGWLPEGKAEILNGLLTNLSLMF